MLGWILVTYPGDFGSGFGAEMRQSVHRIGGFGPKLLVIGQSTEIRTVCEYPATLFVGPIGDSLLHGLYQFYERLGVA
jgi:hypothetical protein